MNESSRRFGQVRLSILFLFSSCTNEKSEKKKEQVLITTIPLSKQLREVLVFWSVFLFYLYSFTLSGMEESLSFS